MAAVAALPLRRGRGDGEAEALRRAQAALAERFRALREAGDAELLELLRRWKAGEVRGVGEAVLRVLVRE